MTDEAPAGVAGYVATKVMEPVSMRSGVIASWSPTSGLLRDNSALYLELDRSDGAE